MRELATFVLATATAVAGFAASAAPARAQGAIVFGQITAHCDIRA
jgi:hypothetical protein